MPLTPLLQDTLAVRVTRDVGDRIRREGRTGSPPRPVTRQYLEAGIRATDEAKSAAGSHRLALGEPSAGQREPHPSASEDSGRDSRKEHRTWTLQMYHARPQSVAPAT